MDENEIALQAKIEELNSINSMKDEEIAKLRDKVQKLEEKNVEMSKFGYDEVDSFVLSQFQSLFYERDNLGKENEILKTRLLKAKAKKHELENAIQALKLKCVPFSPKSPEGYEAENRKLSQKVSNLESDVEFTKDELNSLNEELQNYKLKYEKLEKEKDKLTEDAAKHYSLLKAKLKEEREKMESDNLGKVVIQNESLLAEIKQMKEQYENDQSEFQSKLEQLKKEKENVESENSSFKEQIKTLNESKNNILDSQADFLSSLNRIVGCQTIEEALVKINGLVSLPEKCQKLQEKIDSLKSDNDGQSHDIVISSLKEINEKLSPNNLKLPVGSALRHLFASLSNMFTDALDPNITKDKLDTHILSVVYQARSFKLSSNQGNGNEENDVQVKPVNGLPSYFQVPNGKQPF